MREHTPAGASAPAGLLSDPTVQVHLSLQCNLRCEHCYSTSGPARRERMSRRGLQHRLERLRWEGYTVASFSGGEPLLHPELPEILADARALGYRITLITNGTLLEARRIETLARFACSIGVSVEGAAERHDALRGRAGRLEKVAQGLARLREASVPFAISHCFTRASIQDLPWLAGFAVDQGAHALQLHPLTMVGRAAYACDALRLRPADLDRVALIAALLDVRYPTLGFQVDLAQRSALVAIERRAAPGQARAGADRLAGLANPVVLDAEGALWPLAYGMHDAQRLAPASFELWDPSIELQKAEATPRLRRLIAATCRSVRRDARTGTFDWYGRLVQQSHRLGAACASEPGRHADHATGPDPSASTEAADSSSVWDRSRMLASTWGSRPQRSMKASPAAVTKSSQTASRSAPIAGPPASR